MRYASSGACVVCARAAVAERTMSGYFAERYANDRERFLDACRVRYAENSDSIKARSARWAKSHPRAVAAIKRRYKSIRRARVELGVSSAMERRWVDAQPKVCFYCGADCSDAFHVDHFLPLARGGAHVLTNLRIACPSCNLHKSARDPLEWIDSIERAPMEDAA
jgi:5-methylcytosine-specific restriction endonuclease McrA